ncbi:MAG: trigger factor, partial [Aquificota bacterium]|nr:trigger factor [Aquificota bacterium]
DDFARELGYGSWEEARKSIEEKVREEFERMKRAIVEDAVADRLVKEHEMEIPKTLLRREVSFLVERRVNELKRYGVDPRYLDYRAMAQEFTPQAVANIKLRYILDAYAEKEGIEVNEEDVKEQIEDLAKETGSTPEEIREYFERENLMEVIRADALRRKALRDIIGKVKIKEVEGKEEKKDGADT